MAFELQCIALTLAISVACSAGIIVPHFISNWLGGVGSQVADRRKAPMDSDLIIVSHLAVIGLIVGAVMLWLCGIPEGIGLFAGIASLFVGQIYAGIYVRRLNRFYLKRAHRLFDEEDYIGAGQDAREVSRSSEALRPQAESILRAIREVKSIGLAPVTARAS